MSIGQRIPWGQAVEIAKGLSDDLAPVCVRSKVAGSVRRRRPTVSDIEFVVEPVMVTDLALQEGPAVEWIRSVAARWGEIVKAGPRMIQVRHVHGVNGLTCELYLVHRPAQWGSILAIRTGPRELGQLAVTRMRERGLRHVDGHVEDRDGNLVPTPEEEDFFAAAGLRCLAPHLRDTPAARVPLEETTATETE